MDLKISHPIKLGEKQLVYVQKKVAHLKKLLGKFRSANSRVEVELKDGEGEGNKVHCTIKLPVLKKMLFASAEGSTMEVAVDLVEEKLIQQIDKFKGKKEKVKHLGKEERLLGNL